MVSTKTCRVAKELGCLSVEVVDPADWPVLQKHGLVCALAPNGIPGFPFVKGFNNPPVVFDTYGTLPPTGNRATVDPLRRRRNEAT